MRHSPLPMSKHTLGTWGRATADGTTTYTAAVYAHGSNALVCWARIEPAPQRVTGLVLYRVTMGEHSALKDTVAKAKGQAERWVQELVLEAVA